MNPMMIMKIKGIIDNFRQEHPKMLSFFRTIRQKALTEGSVLEIKATAADGKEYVSNIRLTANDIDLINLLSELGG